MVPRIVQSTSSGLADMPTELLLEILQDNDLSTDDLYNVAVLSRRLNRIALPIFLSRQGIPDPETTIFLDGLVYEMTLPEEPKGSLSGLSIATYLFGKNVETLECQFSRQLFPADCPCVLPLIEGAYDCCLAVRRISNFIRNLASIKTVTLRLIGCQSSLSRNKSTERFRGFKWTGAFEELLNLIVEKGATSLHIHRDSDLNLEEQYQFIEKTRAERALYRIKNIVAMPSDLAALESLTGPWWRFKPPGNAKGENFPTYQPKLSSEAQRNCVLHTLTISSSVLLTPPFLGWALHLISNSKALTRLNFNFTSTYRELWRAILPPLSELLSSKLTELTVASSCWRVSTYELLQFLTHVPKLAKLTIDRSIPFDYTYPTDLRVQSPIPLLENCEFLDAGHNFVDYFLNAHSQSISPDRPRLPKLISLVIYPSSCTSMYDVSFFGSSARDWTVLHEQLCRPFGMTSPKRTQEVSCSLDFFAHFFDISHTIMEYFRAFSAFGHDSLQIQNNAVFQNVTEIKFQSFDFPRDEPMIFCRSLRTIFPDLRRITFARHFYEQQTPEAQNLFTEFKESLRRECPRVGSISIAGDTFKIHGDDLLEA
ncbi:hypothetical protein BYT27DRAFT_6923782 [Phlegmacium glaucopus]|nr:hypothetical protein BYT27DRAFT_6923782 [Phlegmacium glaucopus]